MTLLPALPLLALCGLPKLLAAPDGTGEPGNGSGYRQGPSVILVKSGSLRAVEDVADAFRDACRVHVQQVYVGDGPSELARAREIVHSGRLLVAVGQPAVDLMAGSRAHIVYALVPDPPTGSIGTNSSAAPFSVFRHMRLVIPRLRRIAAISSERGVKQMSLARAAARSLNLELVELAASDSAAAIRMIRGLFVPSPDDPSGVPRSTVDALWLGADPLLVDSQVLQYALQMQIEWRVPVIAATRQQVSFGALMTVDWALEQVGRHLAWQVNQMLDPDHIELVARDQPGGNPEPVINAKAAKRLGIDVEGLRHSGWKVIER